MPFKRLPGSHSLTAGLHLRHLWIKVKRGWLSSATVAVL